MAHEIFNNEKTGLAEIAYTGEKPWHGLGQELEQNATIEDWIVAAGMSWEVLGSPVQYNTPDGNKTFTGNQVLYRSDTNLPLSVVSEDFKVVQPAEVLEFFRDLVQLYDMKLSVAGCLFNGKRFWATAETGRVDNILPGDEVRGQLLLMTGVDGTLATSAKFVSTRVVCNNTLRLAIGEQGGRQARRTHRQTFDAKEIKIDLGLLDGAWDRYIQHMKKLTNVKMNDDAAARFFQNLVATDRDADTVSRATTKAVDELMYRLRNGLGAESGRGTAWNVLNAVTEKYTHGTAYRNSDRQFVNSVYGPDATMKDKAVDCHLFKNYILSLE
jgi:phage/plasmid-like protein (TIGR03299 family)